MIMNLNWANLGCFFAFNIILGGCSDSNISAPQTLVSTQDESVHKITRILILGDSLTEGYGVSPEQAYPALLENKLNQTQATPKHKYQVINGGVTGSTTSGGVSRIDWYFRNPPDFLLISLGGNDGLRGIPPEESKKNLAQILAKAKKLKIPTLLAGMKLPPNYGRERTEAFAKIFIELAEEFAVPFLPFLLEGVGGNPKMNLPDRIHPNATGHQRICQTVYQHISGLLPPQ